MPAIQQRRVAVYDESWKVRAIIADYKERNKYVRFSERDTPGYALARLLGVLTDTIRDQVSKTTAAPAPAPQYGPRWSPQGHSGVPQEHRERIAAAHRASALARDMMERDS